MNFWDDIAIFIQNDVNMGRYCKINVIHMNFPSTLISQNNTPTSVGGGLLCSKVAYHCFVFVGGNGTSMLPKDQAFNAVTYTHIPSLCVI